MEDSSAAVFIPKARSASSTRLCRTDAPAEWGGYNERKRDRHALRCRHSSFAKAMEDSSADEFLPSARFARAPQVLQLSEMRPPAFRSLHFVQ